MKKLFVILTLTSHCYAQEIFYVPQNVICTLDDIKSCFVAGYDLSNWEIKSLGTMKAGTYRFKFDSLVASAPNNPFYLPIKVIYKTDYNRIELSYKHPCVSAWVEGVSSWQLKSDMLAYCTSNNVRQCPLYKF